MLTSNPFTNKRLSWSTYLIRTNTTHSKSSIIHPLVIFAIILIAEPHSLVNLPIPENLVITWPYTDRPSVPQENKCLLSHFLTAFGAQEETDCTSMLWSIDSCQNKVSADQYHLKVSRAQVWTHPDRVLF